MRIEDFDVSEQCRDDLMLVGILEIEDILDVLKGTGEASKLNGG
jgi:hypothetical protein